MYFPTLVFSLISTTFSASPPYGQLSVKGIQLVGSNGEAVQLRGIGLSWSQWFGEFWNADSVQAAKCCFNGNVIRAPMAVDQGGYLTNPDQEMKKVDTVVQAAINAGIYVIINWQAFDLYTQQSVDFFKNISTKYGGIPNVLYEVFNEPKNLDWNKDLVPYHNALVAAIRANDEKNIIVLGTPNWSTDVDIASKNPIQGDNLLYTCHIYACTHQQNIMDKAQTALNNKLPLIFTELGTTAADGDGHTCDDWTQKWWNFVNKNKISYLNWSLVNKAEGSAALKPDIQPTEAEECKESDLTQSGLLVRNELKSHDNGVKC